MVRRSLCVLAALAVGLAGCTPPGPNGAPSGGGKREVDPAVASRARALVLAAEPAGAKGVIEVRKSAKDGDEVVVVGRVGGSVRPFTEGRSSFLIMDPSLPPTETCSTPWDYCEV